MMTTSGSGVVQVAEVVGPLVAIHKVLAVVSFGVSANPDGLADLSGRSIVLSGDNASVIPFDDMVFFH